MRLHIVFVSAALFLAGLNAGYPAANVLAIRFPDSDALLEFSTRAFEEELELYARGVDLSNAWNKLKQWSKPKSKGQGDKDPMNGRPPGYSIAFWDPPPDPRLVPSLRQYFQRLQAPLPASQKDSPSRYHDPSHGAGPSGSRSHRDFD